ncbi:hypothetical protein GCM10027052_01260 [Parafrigoribacterium mesophilum]|uniref:cell division protein PerM n=1 Tax=Parafrigoribacterium mesophilum TaxID=433646 RepID=UPI0031FCF5A6
MNRPLTALFAALEALLVVGIGIGIPLVPLTIMWAAQYGLQVDWLVFWRASVDIWLLGSGTDIRMTLDPALATAAGFVGAGTPFVLTIAPLGFSLLTVLLGIRAGRRVAETPYRIFGLLASIGSFGVLAFAATVSALHPLARPSISQGTLLPTLVFATGVAIGWEVTRRRLRAVRESPDTTRGNAARTDATRPGAAGSDGRSADDAPPPRGRAGALRVTAALADWADGLRHQCGRWILELPTGIRSAVPAAVRGGAMAAAGVVSVASVLVAGSLVVSYARVIGLYESVHTGVLGGVALTLGQLAILPNLVIWGGSWLVGPGFAIGTASAVSPLGTNLGPLPAVPVLGALPSGELGFGFLGLLVPVLAGFLAAVVIRTRIQSVGTRGAFGQVGLGIGIGVSAGVVLGLLAWFSAGAAGPGRLAEVGPNPWLVGGFAALEIGLAAIAGLFAVRPAERLASQLDSAGSR